MMENQSRAKTQLKKGNGKHSRLNMTISNDESYSKKH